MRAVMRCSLLSASPVRMTSMLQTLITPTSSPSDPQKPNRDAVSRPNGSRPGPRGPAHWRNDAKTDSAKPIFGPGASAELRERLLAELNILASGDDAAHWAHRRLRAKNDLSASDAEQVEMAFQAKLATFGDGVQGSRSRQNSEAC